MKETDSNLLCCRLFPLKLISFVYIIFINNEQTSQAPSSADGQYETQSFFHIFFFIFNSHKTIVKIKSRAHAIIQCERIHLSSSS